MPFNLSTGEIVVLLVVAVIVFGGRLPEVARAVGRSIAEVRRGMSEEMRRIDTGVETIDPPPRGWEPPPDGADCDGLGGPKAETPGGETEDQSDRADQADEASDTAEKPATDEQA